MQHRTITLVLASFVFIGNLGCKAESNKDTNKNDPLRAEQAASSSEVDHKLSTLPVDQVKGEPPIVELSVGDISHLCLSAANDVQRNRLMRDNLAERRLIIRNVKVEFGPQLLDDGSGAAVFVSYIPGGCSLQLSIGVRQENLKLIDNLELGNVIDIECTFVDMDPPRAFYGGAILLEFIRLARP